VTRLIELLRQCGLSVESSRIKLVRHRGDELDMEVLRQEGWFETYQRFQGKPVFDACDYIVAFVGEQAMASRFVGVYKVGACVPAAPSLLPPGCPYPEWGMGARFCYEMTKCPGFEDLEDRLVIDWGKGALAWHQWLSDKSVLELRRRGRALPPFRDYLRVHLTYSELQQLAREPAAHQDWVTGLRSVGAIYLVVDSMTGAQYVGSATGLGGLWQRWCDYAKSGHGDNIRLQELCLASEGRPQSFRFSILDTFSRSLSRVEAQALEAFFKRKLGTRAYGLNAN